VKLEIVCGAGRFTLNAKVRVVHSERQNCAVGGVGWTDEPLAAKVERVVSGPARGVETTTVICVGPFTIDPARSPITVESIALLAVTAVGPGGVDTDLLTPVEIQSTLVDIITAPSVGIQSEPIFAATAVG
jgi:hypothetical protein